LTELELYDNQISEITGIENLINLELLDLSYNRITKIQGNYLIYAIIIIFNLGLSTLTKLRRLFLVHNKIEVCFQKCFIDKITNLRLSKDWTI